MYSLLISQKPASGDMPSIGKFDVIDLNPHGTAAPFIDAEIGKRAEHLTLFQVQ
jgi:tRNA G26 N,N-dimethylase Trm1